MTQEKKAIGILGGMGPLATADLFTKIVTQTAAERDNDHVRVYIDDHAQIPDRSAAILHGGEDPLPAMLESVRKLEACGADCLIMPCNTAHFYLEKLQTQTSVPFLSILRVTAEAAAARFPRGTGALLGTTATLSMRLYQDAFEALGLSYLVPEKEEQEALMRVIYDGVKAGRGPEAYREEWETVIRALQNRGADYFVLGCTELPVAAKETGMAEPVIDPTLELARAAIRFAGYRVKGE